MARLHPLVNLLLSCLRGWAANAAPAIDPNPADNRRNVRSTRVMISFDRVIWCTQSGALKVAAGMNGDVTRALGWDGMG